MVCGRVRVMVSVIVRISKVLGSWYVWIMVRIRVRVVYTVGDFCRICGINIFLKLRRVCVF